MSNINDLIYTVESLEMSKDNAHLSNLRVQLRQIAAALRAGQEMRKGIDEQFQWALEYGEARLTSCEEAAKAWDAAVGGGDAD